MNIEWAKRPVVWFAAVVALLIVGALVIRPASGDDSANLGEPRLNGISDEGTMLYPDMDEYWGPTSWPARGELLRDDDLLRRAVDQWRKHEHKGNVTLSGDVGGLWWPERRYDVEILYAGADDEANSNVVLMHYDGLLAKYREASGGQSGEWSIEVLQIKHAIQESENPYGELRVDAIYLGDDSPFGPRQYLVSPNVTKLEMTADVTQGGNPWRLATLKDGLATFPGRWVPDERPCWSGFLRSSDKAGRETLYLHDIYVMSGDPGMGQLLPIAVDNEGVDTHTNNAMLCSAGDIGMGVSSLTWKPLWTGVLPDDSQPVTLVSERAETGGKQPIRWQIALVRGDNVSHPHQLGREWAADMLDENPPRAAAFWWYGKSSRRWFLVVAGAADVTSLNVSGGLRVKEVQGRILIVPGPKGSKDTVPEIKVAVEAHNAKGEPVRVLWTEHS